MKPWKLGQIYKKQRVRKKKVFIGKTKTNKVKKQMKTEARAINQQLKDLEAAGYTILYADETMFTTRQVLQRAYSRARQKFFLDQKALKTRMTALLASISKDQGMDHWMTFDDSVDSDKFKIWFVKLRQKYPFKKLALFLDNL